MTQAAKSQEPSMEEILASIRRIIADDDATKTAQRAPDSPKVESQPAPPLPQAAPPAAARSPVEPKLTETGEIRDESSDILDLTESMASPMPEVPSPEAAAEMEPQFRTIDGSSDIGYEERVERTPVPPPQPEYPERGQLISGATSAAVDSAFSALAQTVLVQNARTLEDLVREMLRPMLKSWLDDNLPGMVERLVRAEIERVSRGRSG